MSDDAEHAGDDGSFETPAPRNKGSSIKITRFVEAEQVQRDLAYSIADLSGAMLRQASLFAHYGVLLSQASRQTDKIKLLLDATEGKIYRALKTRAESGGEKTSDAGLRRDVAVHPRVLQVRQALGHAEEIEGIAKTALEAFRHRRDMLVQQGLISREELKGEISIRRREASDEEAKNTVERFAQARREAAANKADA